MNDVLKRALNEAVELANTVPDEYRQAAFHEAVRYFLLSTSEGRPGATAANRTHGRPVPFAEYMARMEPGPRNNVERCAAAAAHAEDCGGREAVSTTELRQYLTAIRIQPRNFPRDLAKALAPPTVYLQKTPEPIDGEEGYQLTTTGREFIDARLNAGRDG